MRILLGIVVHKLIPMKHLLTLTSIVLLTCYSCSKESTDSNALKSPGTNSTTSSTNTGTSPNRLIFDKDTITQFTISRSTVANHFVLKVSHITSDPVLSVTLFESSIPTGLPKTYTVTLSAVSDGMCGITFMYNGRFYAANSGKLTLTNNSSQKVFTFSDIWCTSPSDNRSRKLSGLILTE